MMYVYIYVYIHIDADGKPPVACGAGILLGKVSI